MTYHLTDAGPKPCKASVRACPLGGEHFEELKDAETAFEAQQPGMTSLKRNPPMKDFDELFGRGSFDENAYRAIAKAYFSERTTEETEALAEYAMSSYYDINEALYGGMRKKPAIAAWIRHLDSALKEAPTPPKELWRRLRGVDTSGIFIGNGHSEGDVIQLKGYSSTSETADALSYIPSDAEFYMRDVPEEEWERDPKFIYRILPSKEYTEGPARNVILKINAKQAAPVSVTRDTVNEQEWLIPRNKKFRIVKIHPNVNVGKLEHVRNRNTRAQVFELEEI